MGFAIPAAIGISRKVMNEEVFCIESDGSFAMSLQELNTVIKQRLNVKIIILDSQGYKSIFLSQIRTGQFLHGFDSGTGLSLPALSAVAKTHEIRFRSIDDVNNLDSDTVQFLRQTGPCILQVKVSAQENALPRLLSVLQADGSLKAPRLIDLNPSL
jgi:acetolactate synthase-1/2/3 large subunit